MKKLIIFILLISSSLSYGSNPLTEGQEVSVVANSGLSLRAAPSVFSEVLEVIPFGESVIILEDKELSERNTERIEWVDGKWSLVSFEGIEGYVFDGFLSPLAVPLKEFELVDESFDFSYAIRSWMDYHFTEVKAADTIISESDFARIIHYYDDNQRMIEKDQSNYYSVELTLDNVRIMDVYHLLLGMVPDKTNRQYVQKQSLFIENADQELSEVKLQLDSPVKITKLKDGKIRLKSYAIYTGCSH